jgi:hypothetical protein
MWTDRQIDGRTDKAKLMSIFLQILVVKMSKKKKKKDGSTNFTRTYFVKVERWANMDCRLVLAPQLVRVRI